MNILLVLAHPRRSSLTGQAAEAFVTAASERGHQIEWADLVAEKFDPILREADEPDWNDGSKNYSAEVRQEMARIENNDATVMFFPVYCGRSPRSSRAGSIGSGTTAGHTATAGSRNAASG